MYFQERTVMSKLFLHDSETVKIYFVNMIN